MRGWEHSQERTATVHIDMPTRTDIERIAATTGEACVSLYLPTSPVPADTEHDRLVARNLVATAVTEVEDRTDRRTAARVEEHLRDLLEDAGLWRELGRSLAVFATPSHVTHFRLPNELAEEVRVGPRFTVTPLLRAVTFPQAAFVLALSQNGARLVEVAADLPAQEVPVDGMPADVASHAGVPALSSAPSEGRHQGEEGLRVRRTDYARAVDQAVRPVLDAQQLPLVLAAAEPMASIYRNLTGYTGLVDEGLDGNPDTLTEAQLADAARGVLDRLYAAELEELRSELDSRQVSGRATRDLSDLARAAVSGAVDTLVVDMHAHVPGTVGEDGTLTLGEGEDDVLEEVARRAVATGARVLAVRPEDLPEGVSAAGLLRFRA